MTESHDLLAITRINRNHSNRIIRVKSGTVIQIQLEEKGGTGYLWAFDKFDTKYLELLKVETTDIAKKEGYTGNPIIKTWYIKAKQKGTTEIDMYYYRPWEDKNRAADSFCIKFEIN